MGVMKHAQGQWLRDDKGFYLLQQTGAKLWLSYKKQQSTHGCAYLLPMDKPSKKFMGLLAQGAQCDSFFGLKQPDADSEVFHDYHDATDEPWLIYLRCKKDKRDHCDALKPDEMKSSKADCEASEEGRLPE